MRNSGKKILTNGRKKRSEEFKDIKDIIDKDIVLRCCVVVFSIIYNICIPTLLCFK